MKIAHLPLLLAISIAACGQSEPTATGAAAPPAITEPTAATAPSEKTGAQGFEHNTDRPGNDYSDFDLQTADASACQSACQNDGKCLAWTYVKPGIQGPMARCWLKKAVPEALAHDCCTSGVIQK